MTAPYFHDGSVDSLEEAVKIMAKLQLRRTLTDPEVMAIITFLEVLTGTLPDEAITVPLNPSTR
jgi:cytochrome c peroxidase